MEPKMICLEIATDVAIEISEAMDSTQCGEKALNFQKQLDKAIMMQTHIPATVRKCNHKWTDATNKVITSGEICLKCNTIKGVGV